jgi:hypothetical protein
MIMSTPKPGTQGQGKPFDHGSDDITTPTDTNFSFAAGGPINANGSMAITTVAVSVRLVYEESGEYKETVWYAATLTNVGTSNASWSASITPPIPTYRYILVVQFQHSPPSASMMDRYAICGTPSMPKTQNVRGRDTASKGKQET